MTEFPNVPEHFICRCGHHQRCHVDSYGQCDHRSCECLIFEADPSASFIGTIRAPLTIIRASRTGTIPNEGLTGTQLADNWATRRDLE